MAEGTWVGLDVHARKTVAGVLDAATGELRSWQAPTLPAETVEWLRGLRGPVRVAYEAGPTGYGLARACQAAGIACTVAAPSKIPRAAADKVKTDRRDAERLARLLRLGELVAVRVPEPHEEAARDLIRAREDARGELMRSRHRLSKLLLRHGLVYDTRAWTLEHDAWLRRQRFDSRPLRIAFEESYGAALQAKTRRNLLDQAITELAAVCRDRRPARLPARRLDADRARADHRARRLDTLPTPIARPIPRADPERRLNRRQTPARQDHQDRQHTRPPAPRRSSLAPTATIEGKRHRHASPPKPTSTGSRTSRSKRTTAPPTLARTRAARQAPHRRRRRSRTRARKPLLGTRDHVAHAVIGSVRRAHRRTRREERPAISL